MKQSFHTLSLPTWKRASRLLCNKLAGLLFIDLTTLCLSVYLMDRSVCLGSVTMNSVTLHPSIQRAQWSFTSKNFQTEFNIPGPTGKAILKLLKQFEGRAWQDKRTTNDKLNNFDNYSQLNELFRTQNTFTTVLRQRSWKSLSHSIQDVYQNRTSSSA